MRKANSFYVPQRCFDKDKNDPNGFLDFIFDKLQELEKKYTI